MKIAIISDSHDNIELLHSAFADAKDRGAEQVLHCGDVVAPYTIKRAHKYGLPIHVIHGNNTGDLYHLAKVSNDPQYMVTYYGRDASIELGGRKIFMVHYPEYAEAMALTAKYDLVCCGHDHHCNIETIQTIDQNKTTLLVNPGSSSGIDRVQPTYAFGDLESLEFEIIDIPEPQDLKPYRHSTNYRGISKKS
ncbi:MAG: metallophosphoesterase family protein [Thiotrichales bacterium]|jgi:hypothetical protein|nr:metallophosphoesterase family protein [Thiotrichales bacterium]MBT3612851.1 metallophosphoesterase family protein [Thiotrichales bacterium]MBT3752917.1 metallophosphoesterase family protein [Thiotrichales bacterium]MBT3837561.1 metallophosphoesterase family protein [Thiotrichales bacterium]MBT4151951.1 metallophosphoesterase family protein [Thiotrichales bacterium]